MTMNTKTSLVSLFNKDKETLEKQLEGLALTEDAEKVKQIVYKFLNSMFENDGEYRQHLTQAEDYILQAALGLFNVQEIIAQEIINQNKDISDSSIQPQTIKRSQYPYTLAGTVVGGVLGTMLGTWGAVFGSIAGTAIAFSLCNASIQYQKSYLLFNVNNTLSPFFTPSDWKKFAALSLKNLRSMNVNILSSSSLHQDNATLSGCSSAYTSTISYAKLKSSGTVIFKFS